MLFYTPAQWNLEGPRDWETMFTITLGLFPIHLLLLGLRISFVLQGCYIEVYLKKNQGSTALLKPSFFF